MTSSRPTSWEAIHLLHAMCERVAQNSGVRLLAIKGPVLELQGLREGRVSADVDVLVHPDKLAVFAEAMVAVGWRRAVEPSIPATHSLTLVNDHWPVGIDVRHHLDGFHAADHVVFDALWDRRVTTSLAGAPVKTCDPVGHIVVYGLHLVREDPDGSSAEMADLVSRARATLRPTERGDLQELVARTDCFRHLSPVLSHLGMADRAEDGPGGRAH